MEQLQQLLNSPAGWELLERLEGDLDDEDRARDGRRRSGLAETVIAKLLSHSRPHPIPKPLKYKLIPRIPARLQLLVGLF